MQMHLQMVSKRSAAQLFNHISMFAHRLTTESIFFDKQTIWLLLAFFGLRLVSFLLVGHPIIQGFILFAVIMGYGMLYYANPRYAWLALIGELLLGGSGHMLELFGLSLRSLVIMLFLIMWLVDSGVRGRLDENFFIKHHIYFLGIPLFIFLAAASFIGLGAGNSPTAVFQDLVPFTYLLLLLPAFRLFEESDSRETLIRILIVYVLGSAIFALFTFILFSTDISILQGEYYKWFRDVAMGKITNMHTGFYRIVLPEHVFAVPLTLIITSLLMKDEKHHYMWRFLLASGLLVLALNLSRGYFLALLVGLLVLKYKHTAKKWFREFSYTILILLGLFMSVHFVASGFYSPGLELFGVRIASITTPALETSSNIRMTLLPPILDKISTSPLIGHGLGSSVSYVDPVTNITKSTRQFDWGYLEMWVELGFFGMAAFLLVIILIMFELVKKSRMISDHHDFYVGLLASLFALLVMNLTAPILFHVFGIAYLAFIASYVMKQDIFDQTVTLLYRVFHKLLLPKLK
jgi:O-antigen ligase